MATAFKFRRPFPFCVADHSATLDVNFDQVGNLTLAEVMAFFWNLETFTISTTGSATNGTTTSATGSIVLNPVTSTTPFTQGTSQGCWYGTASFSAWASFPSFREPRSRVCSSAFGSPSAFFAILTGEDGTADRVFDISFALSTDPSNAGRYRLYYGIFIEYGAFPLLRFMNPAQNTGAVLASGSISIGGFNLNWECTDFGTATTYSGLGMSASSASFTY